MNSLSVIEVKPIDNVKNENNGFKCKVCQKVLVTRKKWRDHSITHKRVYCPKCHKNLSKKNIARHNCSLDNKSKSKEDHFVCEICNFRAKSKMRFASHLRTHVTKTKKMHQCEFCDFESKRPCNVRRHKETCKAKYENLIFI